MYQKQARVIGVSPSGSPSAGINGTMRTVSTVNAPVSPTRPASAAGSAFSSSGFSTGAGAARAVAVSSQAGAGAGRAVAASSIPLGRQSLIAPAGAPTDGIAASTRIVKPSSTSTFTTRPAMEAGAGRPLVVSSNRPSLSPSSVYQSNRDPLQPTLRSISIDQSAPTGGTTAIAAPATSRIVQPKSTSSPTIYPAAATGAGRPLLVSPTTRGQQYGTQTLLTGAAVPVSQQVTSMAQQPVTTAGLKRVEKPMGVTVGVPTLTVNASGTTNSPFASVAAPVSQQVTSMAQQLTTTAVQQCASPVPMELLQPRIVTPKKAEGQQTFAAWPTQPTYGEQPILPGTQFPTPVVEGFGAQPAYGEQPILPGTQFPTPVVEGFEEGTREADASLLKLKELCEISGLKHISASQGLNTMKRCAQDDRLTREQFFHGYHELMSSQNIEMPPEDVIHDVFEIFDRDSNDLVDMMELVCGISILCGGTEEDKIHAIFDIFDENGDGFVSMDEMFKFLTSVFKVVLTPNVLMTLQSQGLEVDGPEDLASITALECFKQADLNHDTKLSVEEFKLWFNAPKENPAFPLAPLSELIP